MRKKASVVFLWEEIMAVLLVEKTKDFTIMSNHHLWNRSLTIKAKELLSLMLPLPVDLDYILKGLVAISYEEIEKGI